MTLLSCGVVAGPLRAVPFSIVVTDESAKEMPCRIHLRGPDGKPVKPGDHPFWFDHLDCDGRATFDLPDGEYHYEVERGPEFESENGTLKARAGGPDHLVTVLRRIAHLSRDGWWSGDLHVHRPAGMGTRELSLDQVKSEIELHLRAEDLHVAPVITWWNQRNFWSNHAPPSDMTGSVDDDRFFHLFAGEDERGGGALLFFNLSHPLPLPAGGREHPEHPSSMRFLEAARREPGSWADVEKPFWLDAPMWFASGLVDSVGIAHNHMNRSGVRDDEAWGRARDREKYPGPHGNGLWTQDIYYHLLNCGIRLPPSAGSASGVLPNPVGYNRVYVRVDGQLTWEKWWAGLRAGEVFVTNGPLLRVRANGRWPGHVFQIPPGASLSLKLDARIEGRDPFSEIEIIRNGKIFRKIPVAAWRRDGSLGEVPFRKSGWFLVRLIADNQETFRFASTGPFYVEAADQPRRISRQSAQFFLDWLRDRMAKLSLGDAAQREEVLQPLRAAEKWWLDKVSAATTEN